MHDLGAFRANLDAIAQRLSTRGLTIPLDEFRALDKSRRQAITETEQLRAEQNELSREVQKLRKEGADATEQQQKSRAMGDRITELGKQVEALEAQFRELLAGIPNVPHDSVPAGGSAEDNVVIRVCGELPRFDFEPQAHWDLGSALGILDFDRAAKITGARFAVYCGLGAKLERALMNFMLDTHSREHGYTEVLTPFMVNSASLYGTGNLPKFAEDLFKLENTDYWLIPTAEVPVTNLFRDETIASERLPIRLCAFSACFRSEAGSYGRDVRGIIRQHQFQKVELVKFARPDQMPRIFCAGSDCTSALCFSVPAIWGSVPPRRTTLKYGCRDRTDSRRYRPAPILKRSRHGARISDSAEGRKRNWSTR